ncbi:hypothetical protein SLS58_005064 [Diplodia intermedia]|uniref:Ubiquitin 3 binding protein But2 C-terminal domain-containing protein n=1 Tax=Diplodia intermedia TaxID=856260 RepID=A0ABR3TRQ9_9PEZI
MKSAAVVFGLALGASAAAVPPAAVPLATVPPPHERPAVPAHEQCYFGINAYGVEGTASEGHWGAVQQLSDGQLRIGQSNLHGESRFYLDKNSGLYDQNRFGCILAGWEQQFQCDHGKSSWDGWSIGFEGLVTFQGSVRFWTCATGDHEGYNIYKRPLPGQSGYCHQVTLVANSCHAAHHRESSSTKTICQGRKCDMSDRESYHKSHRESDRESYRESHRESYMPSCNEDRCRKPVPTPPSHRVVCNGSPCRASVPTPPSRAVHETHNTHETHETHNTHNTCPGRLTGDWEFPHLIVPVDASKPDFAPGTSLFGTVSKTVKTYFNFDIPSKYVGKSCAVVFMLPQQSQLETSSFELKGSGHVFGGWTKEVSKETTFNTAPEGLKSKVSGTLRPGQSYVFGRTQCKPGVMTFVMEGASDTYFKWFQDFNPCPIGLYLIAEAE